MVVQSLGLSGKNISALLPMPSEISQTTIMNAVTAMASIKAKIYDDGTDVNPRVVGVYNTLGGDERVINITGSEVCLTL
jgi:hypothetical protein